MDSPTPMKLPVNCVMKSTFIHSPKCTLNHSQIQPIYLCYQKTFLIKILMCPPRPIATSEAAETVASVKVSKFMFNPFWIKRRRFR